MEGWVAKWYAAITRNTVPQVTALAARVAGGLAGIAPPERRG